MKFKSICLASPLVAGLVSTGAMAQLSQTQDHFNRDHNNHGSQVHVVNVTPRFVTIQQQQCYTQDVTVGGGQGNSGIGAVAGGLLGSTLGSNRNDQLAGTVIGAIVGGMVGNEYGRSPSHIEQRQVCRMVPQQVQQGETVTFSYRGRIFTQSFGN